MQKVITVRQDTGVRSGILITEGPKWLHVIFPDAAGITITKLPNDRSLKITDTLYHGRPYPVTRARNKILAMGRRNKNMTKAARRILNKRGAA